MIGQAQRNNNTQKPVTIMWTFSQGFQTGRSGKGAASADTPKFEGSREGVFHRSEQLTRRRLIQPKGGGKYSISGLQKRRQGQEFCDFYTASGFRMTSKTNRKEKPPAQGVKIRAGEERTEPPSMQTSVLLDALSSKPTCGEKWHIERRVH